METLFDFVLLLLLFMLVAYPGIMAVLIVIEKLSKKGDDSPNVVKA